MSSTSFLFSERQQRILGTLLRNPGAWWSFSDLARAAGPGRGATQGFLRSLEESGFVKRRPRGNQVLFSPNQAHPVFREVRSIVLKTFGLADVLRDRLKPFEGVIEASFVFGSMAKGTDGPGSDVDLLVAGDVDTFDLHAALVGIEEELGRHVHLSVYGADEWSRRSSDPVLSEIANGPKIIVLGTAYRAGAGIP